MIAFKKNKKDIFKDGSGGAGEVSREKKKTGRKNGSLLQREDVIYGMGGLIRT